MYLVHQSPLVNKNEFILGLLQYELFQALFLLQGEDDYLNNLVFYDGYDSYNEESGSSSDEGDDIQLENYSQSQSMTTPYRFMNGNDGMGEYVLQLI